MQRESTAIRVTFLPMNATVQARRGDTLLDAAQDNGLDMPHTCGGNCACTSCHLLVRSGMEHLSPMEAPEEERLATAENRTPQSRLGCQALLWGGPVTVLLQGGADEWACARDRLDFPDG